MRKKQPILIRNLILSSIYGRLTGPINSSFFNWFMLVDRSLTLEKNMNEMKTIFDTWIIIYVCAHTKKRENFTQSINKTWHNFFWQIVFYEIKFRDLNHVQKKAKEYENIIKKWIKKPIRERFIVYEGREKEDQFYALWTYIMYDWFPIWIINNEKLLKQEFSFSSFLEILWKS